MNETQQHKGVFRLIEKTDKNRRGNFVCLAKRGIHFGQYWAYLDVLKVKRGGIELDIEN